MSLFTSIYMYSSYLLVKFEVYYNYGINKSIYVHVHANFLLKASTVISMWNNNIEERDIGSTLSSLLISQLQTNRNWQLFLGTGRAQPT